MKNIVYDSMYMNDTYTMGKEIISTMMMDDDIMGDSYGDDRGERYNDDFVNIDLNKEEVEW